MPKQPAFVPALVAAILTVLGAITTSSISFQLMVAGASARYFLRAPVNWPFLGQVRIFSLMGFLLGLVLLAVLVLLISWLGIRSSAGAGAVVLSTWLAVAIGGAVTSVVSSTLFLIGAGFATDGLLVEFSRSVPSAGHWGLTTGWIAGIGAAIAYAVARPKPSPMAPTGPPQGFAPGPQQQR